MNRPFCKKIRTVVQENQILSNKKIPLIKRDFIYYCMIQD